MTAAAVKIRKPTTITSRKLSKVTSEIVELTPTEASEWLQKYQGPNRNLSSRKVLQYQADMEAGRWEFDASPIRFGFMNGKLRLLDGQHRLTALANSNLTYGLPFLVVRGLDNDAQLVMDQGQARTVGQQLGLRGVANSTVVASVTKFYLDWVNDRLFKSTQRSGTTKPETTRWALEHQDLIEKLFDTAFLKVDAPPSVVGAFALATLQFAPARTVRFLNQLATGIGLQEGDPILALDRRLRNIRRTGVKVSQREYLAYFIKAWNAWVAGAQIQKLQLGRITEDTFPPLLQQSDTE